MEMPVASPPELVIKLAFQFLSWKDVLDFACRRGRDNSCNAAGLVCKRWMSLLDTEDVGRPLSVNRLKLYENIVQLRNENRRARAEEEGTDFEEEVWYRSSHQLLARLVEAGPLPGRTTYRDMFILSERMGRQLNNHRLHGPDVIVTGRNGQRTSLRDACRFDYNWLVAPTIERLRHVFDDPAKNEREKDVVAMKSRLLSHARSARSVLRRTKPTRLQKEELAESIGQYMVTLGLSNSLDSNIFIPSSSISASLGEKIVHGIEAFTGEKLVTRTPKDGKATKKPCRSLGDWSWPMSPVDSLCLLIGKIWPNKIEAIDYGFDQTEEQQEKLWEDAIMKWWLNLAEPIRKLLLSIHAQLSERYDDIDPLAKDMDTMEVPLETVKLIVELRYDYVRAEIAEQVWCGLDPNLCKQIFDIYKLKTTALYDMIQEEYRAIYNETSSPEHNAKLLLDIFLEVPTSCARDPPLTREYCRELLGRMEETMNRWNELVDQVKTDDIVLWNPQTLAELKSFEPKWGLNIRGNIHPPSLEFHVPRLVKVFLSQMLSSKEQLPNFYGLHKRAEMIVKDGRKIPDGNNNVQPLSYDESTKLNTRAEKCLQDFRAFSTYIHTREHAMIALLPLLPHLSRHDAKKLVYAFFTVRKTNFSSSWWEWREREFPNINFDTLSASDIPVTMGDASDSTLLTKWIEGFHKSNLYNYQDGILTRVFGLPLPTNIISAMGEFLVENLYQQNINDVDELKVSDAFGVQRFLERFCYENPDSSHIVWNHIEQAIQNAITVVEEFNVIDFDEKQRGNFQTVIMNLICTCISTRAKRLIPVLRRLYVGTQFALLPDTLVSLDGLIKRVNKPAGVIVDTKSYHSLRSDEL